MRKSKIAGSILLVAAGLLLGTAVWLKTKGQDPLVEDRLDRVVVVDPDEETYGMVEEDRELLEMYQDYNADVVGIIRIQGTVLNHPVVQTPEEETYYLLRGLDQQYNSHGVPFLSANSCIEGRDGNCVIYGHNIHLKKRDVFCDLAGYEDLGFYKEHPIIETVSKSGTRRWLIFAYYLVDNADADPFRYSEKTDFLSLAEFNMYMGEVEKRNWLEVPYDRTINDAYLTLSSCSNELAGSGTNRMVVMAVGVPYTFDVAEIVDGTGMRSDPFLPEKLRKGGT